MLLPVLGEQALRLLAVTAILPAASTLFFFVFWRWFDTWRRRRAAAYVMILGTLIALGVVVWVFLERVFAARVDLPGWAQGIGWTLIAIAFVFGTIADRQLGLHVRAFGPLFGDGERIELRTTGAYAIVRHPIYAAGIGYQLGVLLVTGYPAVAIALVVFASGAAWFTRQEERRLAERLDDPEAYARYRERVPALIPRLWPCRRP